MIIYNDIAAVRVLLQSRHCRNNSERYFRNYKSLRKMDCGCCGAEMLPDSETEKIIIYKCKQCGLSDTRLKDTM